MAKIFPMASEVMRRGYVRKLQKTNRHAQLSLIDTRIESRSVTNHTQGEVCSQAAVVVSGFFKLQRYNERRSREAQRKAEAKRINSESALLFAIKALHTSIRQTTIYIAELKQDDGKIPMNNIKDGKREIVFVKPTLAFDILNDEACTALASIRRKHRKAAAKYKDRLDGVYTDYDITRRSYAKKTSRRGKDDRD